MMCRRIWLVALLASLTFIPTVVFAVNCNGPPISLPWINNTLQDGVAVERGIYVGMGANQILGLRATTTFNNSRVRNARDCQQLGNASAQSGCQGSSGSSFDISQSKTWVAAPPGAWNVTTIDTHQSDETVIDGYDTATFVTSTNSPVTVPNFPLEVWSDLNSDNMSGLALGPDSSFLDKLVSSGTAPSRVFGLFFGSRSELQAADGNLTIGGYDSARFKGPWTNFSTGTQEISTPCPLQVRIKDVRLNNSNGSFSLFSDMDSTIAACVDPLQNAFTFTQAMYDQFSNLTRHPGNTTSPNEPPFTQQTYPAANEPLIGNLTIVLDNGYTTVIPHYELVSQERGSDNEGKYAVVNASRIMVALDTTPDLGQDVIPVLGGVYLSQNYLLVDYGRQMFSMAPAVIGPVPDRAHQLETVCDAAVAPAPSTPASHSKAPVGAIVGGVIGGLAALAGVVLLSLLLSRRRSRQPKQPKSFSLLGKPKDAALDGPSETQELPDKLGPAEAPNGSSESPRLPMELNGNRVDEADAGPRRASELDGGPQPQELE